MLEFLRRVGAHDTDLTTGIRCLALVEGQGGPVLWSVSGSFGGATVWRLREGLAPVLLDSEPYPQGWATGDTGLGVTVMDGAGARMVATAVDGRLLGYRIAADGTASGQWALDLPGQWPASGGGLRLAQLPSDVLVLGNIGSARIETFRVAGGQAEWAGSVTLPGGSLGGLATLGSDLVLTVSRGLPEVATYAVDGAGRLNLRDRMGSEDGLALFPEIVSVTAAEVDGGRYVIIASTASGSLASALSVLRVDSGGQVTLTDHLMDTRDSRFGQIQSLSVLERDGQVHVAAGGGDDGLSLFALLPGGRLVHLDSVAHQTGTGLENVSDLVLADTGGQVQLLVASGTAPGISQFAVNTGTAGLVQQSDAAAGDAWTGGGGSDHLVGQSGADTLRGGGGADILFDGAGADLLEGGAGADRIVLSFDSARDEIVGFDPREDVIDLSYTPMLYDPGSVRITPTSTGAVIDVRGDLTEISSASGTTLSADVLRMALEIAVNRPPVLPRTAPVPEPEPAPTILTPPPPAWDFPDPDIPEELPPAPEWDPGGDPDVDLEGERDGNDTTGRPDSGETETVSLPDPGVVRVGGRARDTLTGQNRDDTLIGRGGADRLTGNGGQDTLKGGAGPDTLAGNDGHDLLNGGAGADWLSGHAGNDTLRGGGGGDRLDGEDGRDVLRGGRGADGLSGGHGADMLAGARGPDSLSGDAGDDTLKGGGGGDRMNGGLGADLMRGGRGSDLIDGLNDDDTILAGGGQDTVRGGDGHDWLEGGRGRDRLLGRDGDDTILGGGAPDWIDGGHGADLLTGGRGADRFVFHEGEGMDRISDFRPGTDRLVLHMREQPLRALTDRVDDEGLWLAWSGGGVLLETLDARDLDAGDLLFV